MVRASRAIRYGGRSGQLLCLLLPALAAAGLAACPRDGSGDRRAGGTDQGSPPRPTPGPAADQGSLPAPDLPEEPPEPPSPTGSRGALPDPLRAPPAPGLSESWELVAIDAAEGRATFRSSDWGLDSARLEAAVVDLRSGQVVSRRAFPALALALYDREPPGQKRLSALPRPTDRLGAPELQEELRAYLDLLRPGGGPRREDRLVDSPDGRTVLLNGGDWLYRSDDGGVRFAKVSGSDLGASYRPVVSADGRWAAFSACTRPCGRYYLRLLPLRPGSRPITVTAVTRPAEDMAFSADGRSLYAVRGDEEPDGRVARGCLMRVDLESPTDAREVACVDYPSYSSGPGFKVSRDASVGVLVGDEGIAPDRRMPYAVVDLGTGRVLRSDVLGVTAPIFPAVSSAGLMAWATTDGNGVIVLDLGSGTTTRRGGLEPDSVAFLDPRTLLAVTPSREDPWVRVVPLEDPPRAGQPLP